MKWLNCEKIKPLLIGLVLVLLIATGLTQSSGTIDNEVIITIAGEEHHYIPRPELGYVVKLSEDSESFFSTLAKYAKPVGGRDGQGLWIVGSRQSVTQNKAAIKTLSTGGQVKYVAPLFLRDGETEAITPEIVVRVIFGIEQVELEQICQMLNLRIKRKMMFTEQEYLVDVLGNNADTVFNALMELNQIESIEWAAPNVITESKPRGHKVSNISYLEEDRYLYDILNDFDLFDFMPDDEYFPMQWHLHNTGQFGGTPGADINALRAWEITTGDPNIIICVQDCGIDIDHPDLVNNLVPGYDFYDNDNLPEPLSSSNDAHGTGCAGLVAAEGNNGIGVIGVAYNCKIMPTRDGPGSSISIASAAEGFRWAAANGADILSYSGGWSNPQPIIYSAIVDITKPGGIGRNGKGCVVCVAAGNSGGSLPSTDTAAYEEVIGIGSTDHNDLRWPYSVYGPELDIVAPSGQNLSTLRTDPDRWSNAATMVLTTDITGPEGRSGDSLYKYGDELDYAFFGGTSAACPIVAGVAALILSIEPNLTNVEVRHFLEQSAKDLGDPGRDDYYGWGRVDAKAALDMVLAKRCDLNNNWKVDVDDFLILLDYWDTNDTSGDIAPAAKRNGVVDLNDFELMLQYWQTEIPEIGLFTHWKLDEVEGDIAYDSSGYSHDANVIGDPNWQPDDGMVDGAIKLSGIENYVSTPFILNPRETSEFSVFAWIKGGLPGQVIISQADGTNWLSTDTEGNLMTELKGGRGACDLISDVVITDGDWHRIGFTWDGDYRILYVDDVIAAIDTQNTLPSSEGGLYIGAGKDLEPGTFWTGLIDDVRIYNRVITP